MHPDIAKTSRENFYENNLLSANTVLENRGWNYALNEPVVKWVHNYDKTGNIKGNKIINPTEVNDIEKELLKFLEWAKKQSKTRRRTLRSSGFDFLFKPRVRIKKTY